MVGGSFAPNITSSASLSITLVIDSSTASNCSINVSNIVNFTGVGSCQIDASQGGNAAYLAATSLSESFNISAANSSITLSITGTSYQFQHLGTLSINAALTGSDGLVTFFYNGKKIFHCVNIQSSSLAASCAWRPTAHGSVRITATFTPSSSNYSGSIATAYPLNITSRTAARG
jgi:hypothetical protein